MRRLLNVNLVDGLNQTVVELGITSCQRNENISDHINLFFLCLLTHQNLALFLTDTGVSKTWLGFTLFP